MLGFFGALFVVINVMEHAQVLSLIGIGLERMIALGPTVGTGAVMVATAVFSAVTDNIPLAAMLAKIIEGIPMAYGLARPPTDPLWWAVIFGANLGGNITPIGSASTLVAVMIIHKQGLKLSLSGLREEGDPVCCGPDRHRCRLRTLDPLTGGGDYHHCA